MSSGNGVRDKLVQQVQQLIDGAPDGPIKVKIDWTARLLGFSFRRVTAYRYNQVQMIPAHEADRIREEARQAKRKRLARLRAQYEALRAELVAEASEGMDFIIPPPLD